MSNAAITLPLGEVCDFQNGFAFKNSDYVEEGVGSLEIFRMGNIEKGGGFRDDGKRVFVPKSVAGGLARFRVNQGDILMSMTDMKASMALLGHTAQCPFSGRFLLNQRVGRITVRRTDLLDQAYLYYYTNSPSYIAYLRGHANSGVQVNLSTEAIRGSPVRIPNLSVQCRVASILSTYDNLIENNNRRIDVLEEMARRLYEEWFVSFRFPGHECEKMVDSELGLVPNGWNVTAATDVCDFVKGVEPGRKHYENTSKTDLVPFLRVGDLSKRSSSLFIQRSLVNGNLLRNSDVAISLDGTVGVVRYGLYGAFSGGVRKIVPKTSLVGRAFLYQFLRSDYAQDVIRAHANGATILHAGGSIKYLRIALPPPQILEKFESVVSAAMNLVVSLERRNANLRTTRDLLLPKLISGELDVSKVPESGPA